MGLLTPKDSDDAQPVKPRPPVSTEAQAASLRARARRRLAGAVALVLAAVIILPMVLDSEPVPVTDDIPIQIPDEETEFQPSLSEPQTAEPTPPVATEGHLQKPPAAASPSPSSTVTPGALPDGSEASPTAPVSKAPVNPVQKFSSQDATPPATKPAGTARSDDGALALALLEGRRPPRTASKPRSAQGSFVLQVASYSGQVEAQARRDQLHEAGVTNAFVEPTSIGGKQQYRLRVGPFPSREAAQAAQARLRMLGYDNGFIASQ